MARSDANEARRARGEGPALRAHVNDARKQALQLSLILFLGLLLGAGCGPAQKASDAPVAAPPVDRPGPEPKQPPEGRAPLELPPAERERHIVDAAAEVDIAERALEENLVKERASPAPPRPPPPPGKPAPPRLEPKEGCERACLALTSMESAVDHLCRLAGPADGRCRKARLRLETATSKILAASCSCSRNM
jgi:hypothetical protein